METLQLSARAVNHVTESLLGGVVRKLNDVDSNEFEPDDAREASSDSDGRIFGKRGLAHIGCARASERFMLGAGRTVEAERRTDSTSVCRAAD